MADTKISRVLAAFLRGERHTRFTAERELHDHCLHSTVSELQGRCGIVISRRYVTVPGYESQPTRCCQYWMGQEEIERYWAEKAKTPSNGDQTKSQGAFL